jgi:hypothetical protein
VCDRGRFLPQIRNRVCFRQAFYGCGAGAGIGSGALGLGRLGGVEAAEGSLRDAGGGVGDGGGGGVLPVDGRAYVLGTAPDAGGWPFAGAGG